MLRPIECMRTETYLPNAPGTAQPARTSDISAVAPADLLCKQGVKRPYRLSCSALVRKTNISPQPATAFNILTPHTPRDHECMSVMSYYTHLSQAP